MRSAARRLRDPGRACAPSPSSRSPRTCIPRGNDFTVPGGGSALKGDELSPEERALVEASRRARAHAEQPLPQYGAAELLKLMRTRVGLTGDRPERTVRLLEHVTGYKWLPAPKTGRRPAVYPGPTVSVTSTLSVLRASYRQHEDDLVAKGADGSVVRHHREAVARYCRALELEWAPEAGIYERRWRKAAKRRDDAIQLPDDFILRIEHIVNDLVYSNDDALNEMYRHRARAGAYTGPRIPSECARLTLDDIHYSRNTIVYMVSKVGMDGGAVLVPRDVFGLRPTVLTHPSRRSLRAWEAKWRPQLAARAKLPEGGAPTRAVWLGPHGRAADASEFRTTLSAVGKQAWPGFHAYMLREIAFIMHCLDLIEKFGALDYELAIQWADHSEPGTFRRYVRKAKSLFRELGEDRRQLRFTLSEWRNI